MTQDWRRWAPDLAVGLVVLLAGLIEVMDADSYASRGPLTLVALGTAAAAGLSRHAPGVALGVIWGICGIQLLGGIDLMIVQVAVAVVAFGTARWGSVPTLWLSALSIPAAGLLVLALLAIDQLSALLEAPALTSLAERVYSYGDTWQLTVALIGIGVLGVPWLAGLALRFMSRAKRSEISQVAAEQDAAQAQRESEEALEIARLQEEQARLARDVHDVVGHSLAVILAQAESAQYRQDSDAAALKETLATIATSARGSLRDVRQVLSTTATATAAAGPGGLDSLVEGVRGSGHRVVSSEEGAPRPLPPELETVAFRVLQEMLTNAIRHGRRDGVVHVERHWEGELRIEVRNEVEPTADAGAEPTGDVPTMPIRALDEEPLTVWLPEEPRPSAGRGLEGMRRRVEAVGGRLDVRRRQEESGPTFTVTAWIPLRAGES
ncbi:sensor histidine kinase [Nocardioides campestrisoli]|uniref:sensor histidine kinase n=1 Tax=Nocardioides campestrisoli TaxID=2736757 RepID=UPI0015E6D4BE|nr:histidine kinase [Nocardioides campestrisoli]